MCVAVKVIRGSYVIFCDTVGELAAALGIAREEVSADGPESCLCNARLLRLGARDNPEGYWPEYVLELAPQEEKRG